MANKISDEIDMEKQARDKDPYHEEDDDEEEYDDEGQDEYEKDGFIVDEEDEEEQSHNNKKKKRKKRVSERNFELDEDDYELLKESNISVPRPKHMGKFKRLKKARADVDEEPSGLFDEVKFDGSGEGQMLEDSADEDDQSDEEDEMDKFIDDQEIVVEHEAPVRRSKVKRRRKPSSLALQEAHELFGDVEHLIKSRKKEACVETSLEDQFDPSFVSEKYLTGKDDRIREIDVPERMQIIEESIGHPPTYMDSINVEKEWIYNQLVNGSVPPFYNWTGSTNDEVDVLKDQISRFLELMHVQKLDVPFIAMYRKEDIFNLLKDPNEPQSDDHNLKWHKVLWMIQDLDQKWLLIQKRKSALQSYYNKRFEQESCKTDETRLDINQQLFKSITKSLEAADSEREVDDVDSKFNLHFLPGEVGQFKRPKRKSRYNICSKAGLQEVARKFGCGSEKFGLHISLVEMMTDELVDPKEAPDVMGSNYTCAMFDTPQAVLEGARHMAAVEISCEPRVCKHVRGVFMDNAEVSTCPADGNVVIDSSQQYAEVMWLRNKPLFRFDDAQWLLIQKAEEEKLLKVTIQLPETVLEKLISESNDFYLSGGVSKSAQLWNEQRKLIVQEAYHNLLLPSMEKEARSLLTSKAKSWLLFEYGRKLWDKVSVAPYKLKENVTPRVMACCWGPGKPATTFVMLDSSGEVLDVLHAASFNICGQSVHEQQRQKNDQQRLQKFMMDYKPHVVVVGAVNLSCRQLKDDVYQIIFKMIEYDPRGIGEEMSNLNVVYGDESLPRLFEYSPVSVDQLSTQEGIIRRAVALGRYLQNPLAMVANLCGQGREIVSWKLHPLDNFLTLDEKCEMVEKVMVDVTNQVGLNINLAASHEWLFAPLQFISGMGPRKAASLQRSLVRTGAIFTRKDLLTTHGLGKKVFINVAGFLRVRRSGLTSTSSSHFIDLLDDTRIHPESYGLAQEFAKDIYYEDGNDDVNDEDEVLEMAIEHVREKPHLLRAVDIHEYAKQKNHLNKKDTLDDIRFELIEGFQDRRRQYFEPNQDEEFCMITGETTGTIVRATVCKVQPHRAICALESGLTGCILGKEDFTDDWRDINDLTDKLREGDTLTCRIKSVQKNVCQVLLTCRESEMSSDLFQNRRVVEPYYHEEPKTLFTEEEKSRKQKELVKKSFKPRMIVHPHFRNIKADEAEKFLSGKGPGESVIRPSSRGPTYLTLTMKICGGVYSNKEIFEVGKEHKDITSMLRIGKTLKIGEDTFDDLDEVMDRYVDRMVAHLKAMLNHRKFRRGTKTEVDELLKKEKMPERVAYCFGISHEIPGSFILTYIRNSNPHHEYVGLSPKGFKFRGRTFEDIDRLVAYFQRHINDLRGSAQ